MSDQELRGAFDAVTQFLPTLARELLLTPAIPAGTRYLGGGPLIFILHGGPWGASYGFALDRLRVGFFPVQVPLPFENSPYEITVEFFVTDLAAVMNASLHADDFFSRGARVTGGVDAETFIEWFRYLFGPRVRPELGDRFLTDRVQRFIDEWAFSYLSHGRPSSEVPYRAAGSNR